MVEDNIQLQRARDKRVLLLIVAAALLSMFTGAVMVKRLPFQGEAYETSRPSRKSLTHREQLCGGTDPENSSTELFVACYAPLIRTPHYASGYVS